MFVSRYNIYTHWYYSHWGAIWYLTNSTAYDYGSLFQWSSGRQGGALKFFRSNQYLDGSKFDHIVGYYGGAIYSENFSTHRLNNVVATNCFGYEGGFWMIFELDWDLVQDVIVSNSTFNYINNRPGYQGGTFSIDGSINIDISGCSFSNIFGG